MRPAVRPVEEGRPGAPDKADRPKRDDLSYVGLLQRPGGRGPPFHRGEAPILRRWIPDQQTSGTANHREREPPQTLLADPGHGWRVCGGGPLRRAKGGGRGKFPPARKGAAGGLGGGRRKANCQRGWGRFWRS